ncbi:PhnD/SsuA/transferrin family substrate-binding protein [Sulfuricystis multivorans]|uniref:substrate-binding domain-containing protein n=1 Tax=Sulfuricystis multivorans TaxID=2211108 RepID=UPI0024DF899B|nr:PhnD/SsuA/transferrin family substrate-binding protein [Sulfuricystis multivorans]
MHALGALAAGASLPLCAWAARPIRVGLTPAFVHDEYSLMEEWRSYLQAKLGRPIEFVQRDSYRETMDLLRLDKLDFAWICDYPYLYLKDLVRLLAVPLNQGKPTYRSYLIVAADDTTRHSMRDLKGAVFAYADPYSNTGYLRPRYMVKELGEDPATFFKKTFFTWSHRKAVEAVATGFAQGAAIDSFVWDTLARTQPALTAKTRIIARSPDYGFPPFVAHRNVTRADFEAMQRVLIGMKDDLTGKMLLDRLNIDGFVAGDRRLYEDVAKMMRAFGEY